MDVAADTVARHTSFGVDNLPPEVLSAIFLLAVGDTESSIFRHGHNPPLDVCSKSLVRLTHVSCRWRSIATSTRLLWSNVQISLDHPFSKSRRLSSIYITRSSPCLFDLTLSIPSYFVYPHLRPALHTLSDQFDRVRSLRLNLGLKFGRELTLNELLGWLDSARHPSLGTLELYSSETTGFTSSTAPRFSTRSYDSLSRLSLRNVAVNWDRSEISGLSVLELDYASEDDAPSFDELCSITGSSPGLSKLRLGGAGLRMVGRGVSGTSGIDTAEETGRVEVDSLRSLEVSLSQGVDYTGRLFHLIRAPLLESLTVTNATSEAWTSFLASTTSTSHILPSSISYPSPHAPTYQHLETLTLRDTPTLITPDFAASTPRLSKLVASCEDYTGLARFLGCVSPEKVRVAGTGLGAKGGCSGIRDGLWVKLREIVVLRKDVASSGGGAGVDNGLDGLRVALARRRFSGLGEVVLNVVDVADYGFD